MIEPDDGELNFPFPEPPAFGACTRVAPGILWARFPLPFVLDHVNVYLIADDDGWCVLDTGISDEPTRDAWKVLLGDTLHGERLSRIICSHHHPDHLGLAGQLAAEHGVPLSISRKELDAFNSYANLLDRLDTKFYRSHGVDEALSQVFGRRAVGYRSQVTDLPATVDLLAAGDEIVIGGRPFRILTGGGHSVEQVMLHSTGDNILLCADQVLARITPFVGVRLLPPDDNPLAEFLVSLEELGTIIPERALVLPGHGVPFMGLHRRLSDLRAHHDRRLALMLETLTGQSMSAAALTPVLFAREMDAEQTGFAFDETLAHLNYLVGRQLLATARDRDGRWLFRAAR